MRQRLLFSMMLAASLMLGGCVDFDPSDWGDSQRFKEDFSSRHKLASGGRVLVEGFNGSIEVMGWDGDGAEVAGTKYASREEVMHDLKVDITSDATGLRIRSRKPLEQGCNCGVKFVLRVPRKVVLESITTTNGSIRVESLAGQATLKTTNGSVKVWSVEGDLDARTTNGSIDLEKFNGAAELKTTNGRVKAMGVKGAFAATTSNGSIDADLDYVETGKPVVLETSNGSINLVLAEWKNNEVRAHTSNSSINVRLPDGVQAELRAATSNGHINSDFEVTTTQSSKTRLAGRIGGGGALLDLTSTNGNIRLLKR